MVEGDVAEECDEGGFAGGAKAEGGGNVAVYAGSAAIGVDVQGLLAGARELVEMTDGETVADE